MKKFVLFIITICIAFSASAQDNARSAMVYKKTKGATVYKQFKPATILLKSGKTISQPLANIFLKNSSLLYISGENAMEANMNNIISVDFDDRKYIKIDSLLYYKVDSVGSDALYKATVIDMDSYKKNLVNNRNITNIDLGDVISVANVDLSNEDDYLFPLISIYYYLYHGDFVRVHERNLSRVVPKDKQRMMKTCIGQDSFSWTDETSLLQLLRMIQ